MKNKILRTDRLLAALVAILALSAVPQLHAQLYWNTNGATNLWTNSVWGASATGPFTSAWSASSDVIFGVPAAGTTNLVRMASTTVGDITVNGTTTITSAGTLSWKTGGSTVTVADGIILTWTGQNWSSSGAQIITKAGNGTWNIGAQGNNLAAGSSFTLSAGRVIVSGNNSFGGANAALNLNGGTLQSSGSRNFANTSISIGGDFEFAGTGTNNFAGSVALGSAVRTITNSMDAGLPTAINRRFSGVISGTGGLTFTGSGGGAIILGAANTYSGKTTVNSGTVVLTNSGRAGDITSDLEVAGGLLDLGTGTKTNAVFTLSGGTITNGTLQATTYSLQGGTIVTGATLGTGTATVTAGATTLDGLLNATTVNVNSGTLNLGAADRLANGAAITVGGGTLGMGANNDEVSTFTITDGTLGGTGILTASTYALNGGTVAANLGAGTLNVGGTAALDGTAAATAINVNSGTLTLGSGSRFIGTTPAVTMAGGMLALGGAEAIGSLSGSSGTVALGANTLTVGDGDASSSYGGGISGTGGGLTKTGAGELTLAANTSYTGATTINGGTLFYNGTNTSTAVGVNSGATLAGSGSVGATTINSGGTMSPGNSPGTQSYASLTWEGGANYNWQLYDADGAAGTGYDTFVSTGAFTINASSENKFNINLWTLSGISPDENGSALNFVAAENFTWTLGTFGSISGFSADVFAINTFSTNGTSGFANVFNGTFSINTNSTSLLLVYTAPVLGDEYDWSGGSGNWSGSGNWTNNAAPPATGAKIYFSGAGGNSTNNSVSTEITGITFRADAGAYVVEGDALSISNIGIVNNSAVLQSIDLDLTLVDSSIFNAAAGDLAFGGTLALGGNTLSVGGAENTDLNGVVSGTGDITKTGAGTLTLGGNNTFTGTLAANVGVVLIDGTQATTTLNVGGGTLLLGASNVLADGATLTLTTGAVDLGTFSDTIATFNQSGGVFTNGTLTATTYGLSGGTLGGTLSGGTANVTGEVSLSGVIDSTVNVNTGGTLTLAAADRIGNGSALTINAGTLATSTFNETIGSLILTNNGSITGSGTITAATYTLNGGTVGANLGAGTATSSAGTTTLNGTLAGDLAVSGGTLTLGANDRIGGSSAVTVSSGTLDFGAFSDSVGSFSLSGGIFTNGTLTAATYGLSGGTVGGTLGTGTANVSGAVSLSGIINSTLNVNSGGTLTLTAADRIGNSSAVTVDNGTLATATFSDTVGSLVLTNNGSLTGSGTITAATYTLNGGTLDANLGSGAATASAGTTALNGTLGAGTVNISGGTVSLGSANRLSDTANVTIASGTLGLGANDDTVGSFGITGGSLGGTGTLTAATYSLGGGTVSANLGAGTATASSGTTVLNGTLAGNLTVSGGTVNLGSSDRLADASTVTVSSGTLAVGANTDTVGTLAVNGGTVSGNGTITASSFTAQGGAIETVLAGSGATFTMSGAGTVTLSAANTFTGGTTIDGGAIVAANAAALGSGSVSMTRDGATLLASGAMTIGNDINISAFQGYGSDGGFIISEYVEGSSNNKYIELYNGTANSITLSDYRIALFANGAATPGTTQNLGSISGGPSTLAAGETLILRNSGATLTLPSGVTSFVSGVTAFNGDDALALQTADGQVNIDIFGVIGNDPGSSWTSGSLSTADQTLTRDASVLTGVSVNPTGTGPSAFTTLGTQWTGYPIDTVSNLGSHFMNAGAGISVLGSEVADAAVTFSGAISFATAVQATAASGGNTQFSGALSGAGAFAKTGAGTVTLSGASANTFTGMTTVSAGTLQLNKTAGTDALAGDVTVSSGAFLLISQSNQVNNNSDVSLSGGTITRGSGVSEVFGNLNVSGSGFIDFGLGDTGTLSFDEYTASALLTVQNFLPGNKLQFATGFDSGLLPTGGNLSNANFSFSNGFTTGTEGGYFTITAIPEPSTYLAAAGLLSLMLWPSRKRILRDAKKILGFTPPMRDRLARRASEG